MSTKTEEAVATTDCGMNATPQQEHKWLEQLLGEWTCKGEASMGPDKPPVTWESTESVRSLGGLWVVGEGSGEDPGGQPTTTILSLGYDPQKGRYVGTFIGSMMSNLWVYEGSLDSSGKILALDTVGPSMTGGGKLAKYQDIVEIKSADERTLRSKMLGEDGRWTEVMTATYRRNK